MKFISDSIGELYKEWKNGDAIFISAPTGSGKTTFILKTLLPYLAKQEQPKKILYLVNRSILKKQMEKELLTIPFGIRQFIKIELYQNIEKAILELQPKTRLADYWKGYVDGVKENVTDGNTNISDLIEKKCKQVDYVVAGYGSKKDLWDYDYVVCDEAHYFLMDSNYNTNTYWSYKFVNDVFDKKVRIFISATLDQVEPLIRNEDADSNYRKTKLLSFPWGMPVYRNNIKHIVVPYPNGRNYDYVDVEVIKRSNELIDVITRDKSKWLIFVDSKESGKIIRKEILDKFIDEDWEEGPVVSFVTSDYENDYNAYEEVDNIVEKNQPSAKVLIATSVLDNGINIKDKEMRNLVILTDTETEFIQMLGRKRRDGEHIKLYICKSNVDYFKRRRLINNRRLEIIQDYLGHIKKSIAKKQYDLMDDAGNIAEMNEIRIQHKFLLQKLMNNQINFAEIRSLFYVFEDVFCLNILSAINAEYMNQNYCKIIDAFGENEEFDEDAFVKIQLKWLNMDDEKITSILIASEERRYSISREKVIDALEAIVDEGKSKSESGAFQRTIQQDLLNLVEHVGSSHPEYKKYYMAAYRAGREITAPFMRFLQENCNIPYMMEVKKGIYTIKKLPESEITTP